VFSANLGFRQVPLRDLIEKRVDVPVAFDHDVRAGGLAEGELGAARGVRDYLFLPIGTGIAGAIVLDGRPTPGTAMPARSGNMIVDPDGPVCGLRCARMYGGPGLRRRDRVPATSGAPGARSRRTPARAARRGDPDALAVWQIAIDALATGLAAYATLLAPELVVIGGGLAEAGDILLSPLAANSTLD